MAAFEEVFKILPTLAIVALTQAAIEEAMAEQAVQRSPEAEGTPPPSAGEKNQGVSPLPLDREPTVKSWSEKDIIRFMDILSNAGLISPESEPTPSTGTPRNLPARQFSRAGGDPGK